MRHIGVVYGDWRAVLREDSMALLPVGLRELAMNFTLFITLFMAPLVAYADAYSLVWQSPNASSAPAPVPIPSFVWPLCMIALAYLAYRYRFVRYARAYMTVAVLVAFTALMVSVSTDVTQADSGRRYTITSEQGGTTLSCVGHTLILKAGVPVKISGLSADFDIASANTLACGTVCEAGSILGAEESCTLKCPGAAAIDSDGDAVADENDAFECNENSSFATRVSGV